MRTDHGVIRDLAAATGVALAAAATLRTDLRRDVQRWTPDSYDYAIRMLMRRGVPYAQARDRARTFVAAMFERAGNAQEYAPSLAADEPEWWSLFEPRVVYPALAAALYPRRGFCALTDVAAASYVASAVLLYRFLRRFGGSASAALLTLWFVRSAAARDVAVHALNDTTCVLLWIGCLDAMVEMAEHGTGATRCVLFTVAMSFTRPIAYIPAASGVALALTGVAARDAARVRAGTIVTAASVVCAAAIARILARAGVPSMPDHFQRVRESQRADFRMGLLRRTMTKLDLWDRPEHSLRRWYVTAVAASVVTSLKHAVTAVAPVIAVPGIIGARRHSVPLLVGALLGALVGCVADPAPGATRRTVVLPLYPVFAAGCVLTIERAWRRAR